MFIKIYAVGSYGSSLAETQRMNNIPEREYTINMTTVNFIKPYPRTGPDGTTINYAKIHLPALGGEVNTSSLYADFIETYNQLLQKPVRNLVTTRTNV